MIEEANGKKRKKKRAIITLKKKVMEILELKTFVI